MQCAIVAHICPMRGMGRAALAEGKLAKLRRVSTYKEYKESTKIAMKKQHDVHEATYSYKM